MRTILLFPAVALCLYLLYSCENDKGCNNSTITNKILLNSHIDSNSWVIRDMRYFHYVIQEGGDSIVVQYKVTNKGCPDIENSAGFRIVAFQLPAQIDTFHLEDYEIAATHCFIGRSHLPEEFYGPVKWGTLSGRKLNGKEWRIRRVRF